MADNETYPVANQTPSDEQISLWKQQDEHQFEYSLEVLKAQERDRNNTRNFSDAIHKRTTRAWIYRSIVLAVFILIALYLGKDQFLLESMKYLALLFGGGGIGYLYGYKKGSQPLQ